MGTVGIEEQPSGLCAYFEDVISVDLVRQAFSSFDFQIVQSLPPIAEQPAEASDPIFVGKRFIIVPVLQSESQRISTPDRIVLPIDAAMAFGSGRHETTQLCLQALEAIIKPGDTVLDIGCGSGILALAAQKLGASSVTASDIDEAATAVARRHFSGPLFVGSADALASEVANVVICNITGKVADRLAWDLKRILTKSGLLIVSGFLRDSPPSHFKPCQVFQNDDWAAWICNQSDVTIMQKHHDASLHDREWWL